MSAPLPDLNKTHALDDKCGETICGLNCDPARGVVGRFMVTFTDANVTCELCQLDDAERAFLKTWGSSRPADKSLKEYAMNVLGPRKETYGEFLQSKGAEGRKDDSGKLDMTAVSYHPNALAKIAKVLDHGAEKYGRDNWRKVPGMERRYIAAGIRHLFARARGERIDPESGLPHLAHLCCCALFLLELGD